MAHNLFMHHAGSYREDGTFDEYAGALPHAQPGCPAAAHVARHGAERGTMRSPVARPPPAAPAVPHADDSCAMGYCCSHRCWNTPHMWQQGWVTAAEFDASNMEAGQTATLWLDTQVHAGGELLR